MDILFNLGSKQRNGTDDTKKDILQSKKIESKCHVCSSYFLFPFYFTPENIS